LTPPVTNSGGQTQAEVVRILIHHECDIVAARQAARQLAAQAGVKATDLTLLATAVSEVARNIVRFTAGGEIVVEVVHFRDRKGVRVTARDVGPGMPDVDRAMADGFTTCAGLGVGLPGARRLMDEFAVVSDAKRGTTVTMTKWSAGGRK
jgi:anti-sigma regulatory factor (Ser/Thr protein kinase)